MSDRTAPSMILKISIGLLVVSALAGAAFAVIEVRDVLDESAPQTPLLFDHGLTLRPTKAPAEWTNESCGKCHQEEYDEWKDSLHALSASNSSFHREVLMPDHGREHFCINCHAPQHPLRGEFPLAEPDQLDDAFESKAEWVTAGVDCLTCHVRDGKVLGVHVTEKGEAAHPMRAAPELARAEFCASCHQFGFKIHNFPDGFTGALQQASFEEFLDVRRRGEGAERCQDCHLAGGNHHMGGGYSREMLEQAVSVEVSADWRKDLQAVQVTVDVLGGSVGHRIPGGEHFRYLRVVTTVDDKSGSVLTASGGAFDVNQKLTDRPEADRPQVVRRWPHEERLERILDTKAGFEVVDTRLWPGERRRFVYLMPTDRSALSRALLARAEVWYHVMNEEKARLVNRPLDDVRWKVTEHEDRLPVNELP